MRTFLTTKTTLGLLAIGLMLTGWGCKKTPQTTTTSPQATQQVGVPSDASLSENYALVPLKQDLRVAPVATSTKEQPPQPTSGNSYYEEFAQSKFQLALSEQRPTILYFFATWDETTLAHDRQIATWINGDIRGIRGFRVNFDNEAGLRQSYDVSRVDTAIFIGVDGKEKMRLTNTLDEEAFRAAMTLIAQQ